MQGDESESESQQTTADMFKDMLNQKKNMLLSKLTSFDSDVSSRFRSVCMIFLSYPDMCLSGIFIFSGIGINRLS